MQRWGILIAGAPQPPTQTWPRAFMIRAAPAAIRSRRNLLARLARDRERQGFPDPKAHRGKTARRASRRPLIFAGPDRGRAA
jgi:hypothetical protein